MVPWFPSRLPSGSLLWAEAGSIELRRAQEKEPKDRERIHFYIPRGARPPSRRNSIPRRTLFGSSVQVVPMATPAQVSEVPCSRAICLGGYLILELPTLLALVLWIWKQRGCSGGSRVLSPALPRPWRPSPGSVMECT